MCKLAKQHEPSEHPLQHEVVLLKLRGFGGKFILELGVFQFGKWLVKGSDREVHPVGWYKLVDVNGEQS